MRVSAGEVFIGISVRGSGGAQWPLSTWTEPRFDSIHRAGAQPAAGIRT